MNSVALPEVRVLSLFSGVEGLGRGFKLAVPGARVVGYVERDAYAASVLMARMEDEVLDRAPVWCGQIEDMDAAALRGYADCVIAGFPCPPVSVAGKRGGAEDERWLWPEVVRMLRAVEPRWVFLENVRGLLSINAGREFGEVLGDLARLGFDAEWLVLSADAVGAAHERERVFVLAENAGSVGRRGRHDGDSTGSEREVQATGLRGGLADTGRGTVRRKQSKRVRGSEGSAVARQGRKEMADAESERIGPRRVSSGGGAHGDRGGAQAHGSTSELCEQLPLFAPGPGLGGAGVLDDIRELFALDPRRAWERYQAELANTLRWREIIRIAPQLAPAVESGFRCVADGRDLVVDESRADQVRCTGNGVVDVQAAAACCELLRRFAVRDDTPNTRERK